MTEWGFEPGYLTNNFSWEKYDQLAKLEVLQYFGCLATYLMATEILQGVHFLKLQMLLLLLGGGGAEFNPLFCNVFM